MVQNQSLKSEIQKLEQEKMRLMQVLSGHDNACLQRMQQEAIEIKQEGLPSPIDENEFRVPSTVPIVPSISQGSITTGASFTEPVSAYTENTTQNTQPLLSNNVLLVNETNVLPYTMSQGNPHLHNQSLMTSGHGLVGNLSPPECHPPSFDEAVRIATEIKMEELSSNFKAERKLQSIHFTVEHKIGHCYGVHEIGYEKKAALVCPQNFRTLVCSL